MHNAVRVTVGHEARGLLLSLLAVDPHDPQSTLARGAPDRMVALQDAAGAHVAQIYRYDGTRALPTGEDRFWRMGYGYAVYRSRDGTRPSQSF